MSLIFAFNNDVFNIISIITITLINFLKGNLITHLMKISINLDSYFYLFYFIIYIYIVFLCFNYYFFFFWRIGLQLLRKKKYLTLTFIQKKQKIYKSCCHHGIN